MSIIGKTIKRVRPMTEQEKKDMYWYGQKGIVIELDDGSVLYPSQDEEGNGPGVIFHATNNGLEIVS